MCSAHAHRLPGLLLGFVAAASLPSTTRAASAQTVEPATASPHSVVTAEEIQRVPGRTLEQWLTDRFPSVTVTRTTRGGISVRVHGVSSFLSSNEPLYVIDDVPMSSEDAGGLRAINPYDIVSIEVVKDPVGTAVYGVRGANGVIIIKTKRPGS